jgi:hypothetical protein
MIGTAFALGILLAASWFMGVSIHLKLIADMTIADVKHVNMYNADTNIFPKSRLKYGKKNVYTT